MSLEKEVPKMHDPKTRLENFEFFQLWMDQIDTLFERGRFNVRERNSLMKELRQKTRKKIFPRDNYFFSTVDHMSCFLRKNGFGEKVINSFEDHEQAHYDKATQLGYEAGVQLWLLRTRRGGVAISPAVNFTLEIDTKGDHEKKKADLEKISLAPEDPSFTDKEHKFLTGIEYYLLKGMLMTKDMNPLNPMHYIPRKLHEIYLRNFMIPWSLFDTILDEEKRKAEKDRLLQVPYSSKASGRKTLIKNTVATGELALLGYLAIELAGKSCQNLHP